MSWFESQIETRTKLDKELVEHAYTELAASVTSYNPLPTFALGDAEQVDGAARLCLAHYGIEPGNVPDDIQDAEERLDWLCRPSGTMRRTINLNRGWYMNAFGCMLGRLETGEAVALLPNGVRGYCFMDPTTGERVKITRKNADMLQSKAVLFYRALPSRPLELTDLLRFILGSFSRGDISLVLFAALIVALIGLIPPQVNKIAFGTVIPGGDEGLILPLAVLLLGTVIGSVLINTCRSIIMSRVSTKITVAVEAATYARILSLPTLFFKQYPSGNLGTRVSNTSQIALLLTEAMLGSGLTAVLGLVYIVQICAYAAQLALPALIIVLLQAGLTVLATMGMRRYNLRMQESAAKLSGTVTALLNGVQKIKLAGAEDRAFAQWAHDYAPYARAAYNRPAALVALPALVSVIGLLGNIVIYFIAGSTGVAVDDYMAFNTAYGQVSAAIMMLASMSTFISQLNPLLEMVKPILEAQPEIAQDKHSVTTLSGGIEVANVSFRYSENTPYVVENLSFKVSPGEYVALVGKSGCGKSTVMRLLLGFEKPDRGSIQYGPFDVQKIDLRSLRQHIGVVMQDGTLFSGDIASNITISTPGATLDDAWEAAEIAGIADDIRKMPMGMQTFVTEGSGGVSGGQRQRLMIARAVCGKRRILMFDEATSALDNLTQKHVSDALSGLKCTRVVVAHRLSTVKSCDRILVMDGGRIAEEGTYDQLIAKDGLFAALVKRQRLDGE